MCLDDASFERGWLPLPEERGCWFKTCRSVSCAYPTETHRSCALYDTQSRVWLKGVYAPP